jgi:hypothetical protein
MSDANREQKIKELAMQCGANFSVKELHQVAYYDFSVYQLMQFAALVKKEAFNEGLEAAALIADSHDLTVFCNTNYGRVVGKAIRAMKLPEPQP